MRTPLPAGTGGVPEDGEVVDVCVIGAGIAGLTTAYELSTRGFGVLVLEGGTIGSGETLRTTAHLASALDERFTTLERRHGFEGASVLVRAHSAAIAWIERFCRDRSTDCGFRRVPGYLYELERATDGALEDELAACRRAGLSVDLVDATGLPHMGLRALRYADQAEIDAGKYVRALAEAVLEVGVRVCESTPVVTVEDRSPSRIVLEGGRAIFAKHVVCATNAPIVGGLSMSLKQAAYRSYVVAFEIPTGATPRALHWDMEDPYHYVRVADGDDPAHELLIVGGEDRKVGQDEDPASHFASLEAWGRSCFPEVKRVIHRWSGQIMEPFDGVGLVGRTPGAKGSSYLITGDSGNGMTLGTLGGVLVADLLAGRMNEWTEIFDPSRSVTHALGTFVGENLNAGKQYLDLVRGGDVKRESDISHGEGAIVRDGTHLLAVYRDDDGRCHTRSALCPHLGGVVRWNSVESTWDCPCHGSRFDRFGQVIIGPATSPLGKTP